MKAGHTEAGPRSGGPTTIPPKIHSHRLLNSMVFVGSVLLIAPYAWHLTQVPRAPLDNLAGPDEIPGLEAGRCDQMPIGVRVHLVPLMAPGSADDDGFHFRKRLEEAMHHSKLGQLIGSDLADAASGGGAVRFLPPDVDVAAPYMVPADHVLSQPSTAAGSKDSDGAHAMDEWLLDAFNLNEQPVTTSQGPGARTYDVFVLARSPSASCGAMQRDAADPILWMGQYRHGWVHICPCSTDIDLRGQLAELGLRIAGLFASHVAVLGDPADMSAAAAAAAATAAAAGGGALGDTAAGTSTVAAQKKLLKKHRRKMAALEEARRQVAVAYHITVTLLNAAPQPGPSQGGPVPRLLSWGDGSAATAYLLPFLRRVAPLATLRVEWQTMHYGSLTATPATRHRGHRGGSGANNSSTSDDHDTDDEYYYVTPKQLQRFVGINDYNAGSGTVQGRDRHLHLVAY
eukprot:g4896.t1